MLYRYSGGFFEGVLSWNLSMWLLEVRILASMVSRLAESDFDFNLPPTEFDHV
jgi:hypothetical protein